MENLQTDAVSIHCLISNVLSSCEIPVSLESATLDSLRGGEDTYAMLAATSPVQVCVDSQWSGPYVFVPSDSVFRLVYPADYGLHECQAPVAQAEEIHAGAVRLIKFYRPKNALNLAINSGIEELEQLDLAVAKYPALRSLLIAVYQHTSNLDTKALLNRIFNRVNELQSTRKKHGAEV